MPSNDTENIYSTQYGGEGEPIPATKISYDNDSSGLTADDAQGAIDELAGKVDKVIDGELYAYHHTEKISITPDTTKSINENLTALRNALLEFLSELTDPCWKVTALCANNDYLSPVYSTISTSQQFSADFIRILTTSSALIARTVHLESSLQDYITVNVDAQGFNFTQTGQGTATNTEYFVSIEIYKKIGV